MKDNSRLVKEFFVIPIDMLAFENLGFGFETTKKDYYGKESLKVIFPIGWTMTGFNDDCFTADFLDENGCSRGKIDFGCYPNRKGYMWLF